MEDQPDFVSRLAYERMRLPRILVVENDLTLEAMRAASEVRDGHYILMGCELLLHRCKNIDIEKVVKDSDADGLLMRIGGENEAFNSLRRLKDRHLALPTAIQMRGQADPIRNVLAKQLGAIGFFSKDNETQPGLCAVRDAVLKQRETAMDF